MVASAQISSDDYPWQATMPSILRNIKDEFEIANNTRGLYYQPVRKKLTTEALVMLLVILSFVILTVVRGAISVYERFTAAGKEIQDSTIERKGKAGDKASNVKEEMKSSEISIYAVFLTNLRRFLDCFCIESNLRRILNTVSTEEKLCGLHGIRSVVLIWVLVGHTSTFYVASVKAPEIFQSFLNLKETQILKNAIFIVDSFLVLSGFLNGYFFSQLYEKRNGKIPWLLFYVHRFVRISPLYYIALGFYATLLPYLGSGPVWPTYDTNPVCKENGIWNVLFLGNFVSHKRLCSLTTWFLSCEMQLYIISPIFLVLLMKRPKFGYALTALAICGSSFINFFFTKQYQLVDGPARIGEHYTGEVKVFLSRFWYYYDVLYSKPYARLGTYLIGMALGYYLYGKKTSTNEKKNQLMIALGWIMAAIFMWFSLFALYGREESILENAIYNGLKHVLFSFSIGWIIFVCVTEQRGLVNRFFSSKIFLVISRLSYSTYLTHMMILEVYFLSQKDLIDHSLLQVILHILMSVLLIAAAFVVSLIFEAPILNITAMFFGEKKKGIKSSKQE